MSEATYTPEFVERQYNNRAAVPDFADWFAQWRHASQQTRESLRCELDVRYGRGPNETMDIFPAEDARGLFVFIHGGYWRSLDKSDFSFVASHFVGQGIGVAVVNYDLCPAVSIETICEQIRRALLWLGTQGRHHSLAAERVVVGGHSAGGHLAAILFATDWDDTPLSGCIRGGVSVSGVFDLEPLVQFSYNSDLGLTDESARAVSPARMRPLIGAPMVLCVGGDETEEFKRQSQLLWDAWPQCRPAGMLAPLVIPGRNHFSVVSDLAVSTSPLTAAALRLFD
jgi:arylformamidase